MSSCRRPLVDGDQHAGARGAGCRRAAALPACRRQTAAGRCRAPADAIISRYSSIRSAAISEPISTPLPMITRFVLELSLSSATAAGTSPCSRVEFGHSSRRRGVARGDVLSSVVQGVLERAAPGVPGWPAAARRCAARTATRDPAPIRSPILATIASSLYGTAQPPCANPSRVSSSGRPGPCITPSSVTLFITMTLPIFCPFGR